MRGARGTSIARRRSPAMKPPGSLVSCIRPRLLEKILERQIFAERHQMNLVVHRQDRAVVVDHVDRIVGALDLLAGRRFGRADRAGDQHRAFRQQRRDLRQRVGLARQQERKRRFRPDQMGDVAHAGRLRAGRAVRQLEIVAHHLLLGAVVELLVLLQIGLHDAQPHAFDEGGRRAGEPHRAVARERGEQHHAERERQPAAAACRRVRRSAPPGSRTPRPR